MKQQIAKLIAATACSLLTVTAASTADADVGGSYSKIQNAINGGGTATLIAELERAESLVCPACVTVVMPLLDSDTYEVREVAAWWFARRPGHKKMLTERSILRLAGSDPVAARNAADILGTFRHPQAIPALASALARTDFTDEARAHAAFALGTIGHRDASPALAAAMQSTGADVRLQAVSAWMKIRGQSSAAPAVALVGDENMLVRRKAVGVIGYYRDEAGRVALEQQLASDADPVVRRNAAWALGRIGNTLSRDVLIQAASDTSSLVRSTARAAKRALR